MAVGLHVGMGQGMFVAEREERPEPEPGFGVSIDKRVTNHELGPLVDPEHLLFEDYASHAIGNGGGGGVLEVGDVLVPPGFVSPLEAVERQVECLVVLDDGFVERRQEDIGPV